MSIKRLRKAQATAATKTSEEQREREQRKQSGAIAGTATNHGGVRDDEPREKTSAPLARLTAEQANKGRVEEQKEKEKSLEEEKPFKAKLVWTNIILFVLLHSALPIGAYMIYTQRPWFTMLWMLVGIYASVLGVTAGTHRLWSHRSYRAKWPVQVLLMLLQTMAGQNSIYTWSRDHRVHHKFAETSADPHNILRGFFFAHMGWLCCKKHPDVKEKGALIDMSDLESNRVVMFQHRHFWWLAILFTVLVPTLIPMLLWNELFWTSFVIGFMWRYIISLHGTWLVNSAAHYHGDRPYDERIEARESPVVIWTAVGEGFHNYHHTFPFDYSTSEYGAYFNITTAFIDLCAALGLAYDLRKVDGKTIDARRARTGDQRNIIRQASLHSTDALTNSRDNTEIPSGNDGDIKARLGHQSKQLIEEQEDDGIELISERAGLKSLVACGGDNLIADLTAIKFSL